MIGNDDFSALESSYNSAFKAYFSTDLNQSDIGVTKSYIINTNNGQQGSLLDLRNYGFTLIFAAPYFNSTGTWSSNRITMIHFYGTTYNLVFSATSSCHIEISFTSLKLLDITNCPNGIYFSINCK